MCFVNTASPACPQQSGEYNSVMKIYKVGIIGFGMIGKVHAFGYATLPYYSMPMDAKFHISHVSTAHPETAERARKICGADIATTDFREITTNPGIDIVHICSPNEMHFEQLRTAIESGKHIYCDKPMTVTREEAEEIQDCLDAAEYTATSQMTFHLRFFPAIRRAKQLVEQGRLGKIYQFRMAYLHSSHASAQTPMKWKHSASGGAVRDIGSHLLDLADFLLGPLESLLAETQLGVPLRPRTAGSAELVEIKVEDAVTILAKTKAGAHGILEASKLASGNEDELRFEINGEQGSVRFSLMAPHYLDFFDVASPDKPLGGESGWKKIACGGRFDVPDTDFPSPKSTIGWTRAHAACLSNFLHAVVEGRRAEPDLHQGIKIDRLIDDVFHSAYARSWIEVK